MGLSTDDIVEIQHLYARYYSTLDSHDPAAFVACFTPDGSLDSGAGVSEGADALTQFANDTNAGMPGLRHHPHSVVCDGDGDAATGSAFLVVYDVTGGYSVLLTGRYKDELTRTPQGWRFTKRQFVHDS